MLLIFFLLPKKPNDFFTLPLANVAVDDDVDDDDADEEGTVSSLKVL